MKILTFIVGLCLAMPAFAGLMAEPSIGVASGSLGGTTPSGGTLTPTTHDLIGFGVRVGYRWTSAWTVLEASSFTGTGKAGSSSYDMSDTNIGVLFGYDFAKYRLFAGYMPSSTLKQKDSSSEVSYTGTAMKFGFGTYLTANWTVNVEMLVHNFSKVSMGSAELDVSSVYGSLKDIPVIVTLGYVF